MPTLMDLIARRANNGRGSARDELDAQPLGGHLLKAGIVCNKDVKHKRTCGLMARPVSTSGFSSTKMYDPVT